MQFVLGRREKIIPHLTCLLDRLMSNSRRHISRYAPLDLPCNCSALYFLETLFEKPLRLAKVYSSYQCILNITTIIAQNRILNFLMTTLPVVLFLLHLMSVLSFKTQKFVPS
jgi:hypothetical protein